jgi:hypothetical protein
MNKNESPGCVTRWVVGWKSAALGAACVATMACAPELEDGGEPVESETEALTPGQIDPVRVQVILASYDDGSFAPTVTPEQIRVDLNQATQTYAPASIRFEFDPQTDVLRINSTLLARECTLAPGAVLGTTTEPACDYARHNDERNRVAQTYPGKLVVYFSAAERTSADANGIWSYGPKTFNWSNGTDSFVTMMRGDPGDGIGHEMGHYLHLPHIFGALYGTLADARNGIKSYVETNQLAKTRGYDLFDGDGLAGTPPDPGSGLFQAAGLDPCNAAQGTLNLLVTFTDRSTFQYTFTPDRENIMNYWNKECRGKQPDLLGDQANVVRFAIDTDNRTHLTNLRQQYSAVFEAGNTGETRAIGWAFTDFVTRFDQEIAAGKHLTHMQASNTGTGMSWDGVWDNGSRGTTRALGWAMTDFAGRFDQEIAAGRHLVHMQAYNTGTGMLWDGVWETGARTTTRAIGWALTDFVTRFDQEIAAGRHLVHMQAYDIGGGQIRYDGVWESGARTTTRTIASTLTNFATRFNQEIAAGRHLVHMQAYDTGGGQIRYDGVWETGSRGTTRILSSTFGAFVLRNEQEQAAGKKLVHFQPYDVGNGQIRYDGVWETSTTAQTHVFAETIYKFAEQFNNQLTAGKHAVLMQSVRGR